MKNDSKCCSNCNVTVENAYDNVLFSVDGNIMSSDDGENFGGIVGGNIASGQYIDKWETKRDGLAAVSNDMSLRVHSLVYCKECLLGVIHRTRSHKREMK